DLGPGSDRSHPGSGCWARRFRTAVWNHPWRRLGVVAQSDPAAPKAPVLVAAQVRYQVIQTAPPEEFLPRWTALLNVAASQQGRGHRHSPLLDSRTLEPSLP